MAPSVIARRLATFAVICVGLGAGGILSADDEVELFYGYYKDDARLEVKSPSVSIQKDVLESTTLALKYIYETFTKSAPEDAVDAVSGATTVAGGTGSGFKETRRETAFSASHAFGDNEVAAGIIIGDEDDFDSTSLSLAYTRELLRNNVTFTALYGFTTDEVQKLDAQPDEGFPKTKDTNAVTLSLTQLLSPTALISGGYSYANVDGFQSNPLRRIAIETPIPGGGVNTNTYDEIHPISRDRHTLFLRGTQYFRNRSSLDLNLALYNDDWGVDSVSVEARYYRYLNKSLYARLRHRYYSQGKADFYKSRYSQVEPIMTADTRLRAFESQLTGLQFTYLPRETLKNIEISAGYDRYRETNNGLSADVVQLSVVIPY